MGVVRCIVSVVVSACAILSGCSGAEDASSSGDGAAMGGSPGAGGASAGAAGSSAAGAAGGSAAGTASYPPPPYGNEVGQVLPNLKWQGYVNDAAETLASDQPFVDYSMADLQASGRPLAIVHVSEFT